MAIAQFSTPSLNATSLYGSSSGTPSVPTQTPTPYTGTITAQPDAPSNVAQGPNTTPASSGSQLVGDNGYSGYPVMSPQQSYNTANFYYGDAPGETTHDSSPQGTQGSPMTDTYGGGGNPALDMTPGQHATADARYTTLGGVGPGAPVAQNLANNLNLQAIGDTQRVAPQIATGAVNMIAGGAGTSLNQANGVDFLGLGNAGNLAATATGDAANGQLNAANALYGAAGGQSVIGGMNASGQLLNAANGPGVTGQMLAGNLLGQAAYGDAYQGVLGAGQQLQGIANQGGLNTGQQLLQAAYGPGVSQQNGLALQMNAAAYNPNITNQQGLAGALSGTAGAAQIGQQNALAAQLAGSAYGPTAASQAALGNQLAGAAFGPNAAYQSSLANQVAGTAYGPAAANQAALANQVAGTAYGQSAASQAALANQLAGSANGPTTAGQLALANRLAGIGAMPAGPSVAQQQLKMGADASMQQQMAMASAARGGNTALALQNAGANQGAVMGQLNQQQALLRAQEDMANRQLAAQTTQNAAGIYGNVQNQQAQAIAAAGGMYGNLQGQQAAALANAGGMFGSLQGQQAQALGNAAGLYGNLQGQQTQALGQAAGVYGNLQGQQAAALQGAAGLYGNTLGQQQQAYGQAANLYGNVQGQQLAALQGAAGTYGNAAQLQGSLLGAASQTDLANRALQVSAAQGAGGLYGNAGQLQGSLLGAAGSQYANAAQTQNQALAGAAQGYTASGQLQGSLLGGANQAYAGAAGTQQAAYGNAGQLLQGIAGNQVAQANTQAGVANTYADLSKTQAGLQLAQTAQNDQAANAAQLQAYQALADQRNAEMNLVNQNIQSENTRLGINAGISINQANLNQQANQANMAAAMSGGGAALSGLIGLAALSDIRAKTDIVPASGEVADAFRPLSSSSYLYKDPNAPGAAQGTQYGPMAQELEQTPAGATAVMQMPNGKKGIDTGRLSLLNASQTADLTRRLDNVEAQAGQIQGTQVPMPNLYQQPAQPIGIQPTRAPMIMQLPPQAPAPIAASRAPMVMSTPSPGANFARYGTPTYDYGGMPDSAPIAVNIPTPASMQKGAENQTKLAQMKKDAPFGWLLPEKAEAAGLAPGAPGIPTAGNVYRPSYSANDFERDYANWQAANPGKPFDSTQFPSINTNMSGDRMLGDEPTGTPIDFGVSPLFSDMRAKRNIRPAGAAVSNAFRSLQSGPSLYEMQ